ncbi:MAG TPA: molybdenum cofactor biosynthesis protein MoaE [Verrucomicrobiales bacterium]|nr:molybdenum cofactor biosynthesis protein MoaE [Pedosphaera sp.]MBL6844988.1 molybdenum cofactor biosynthesis protein MoaE [Verrucomicrobiae bacterium]RZO69450.1 MAG: molybdenum cofactor biosynthesis protein MoaE [Limisphaerales bacterium]HAO66035.1 molybdenum cofactor biosynthesis protein MoaE [Verrucomicrobiales bacterium]HAR00091.1 molybdenum cofactor biosynthesis protein MoaE [Verrucomicrobiales bacterium]|tara:strand:+ start:851 stop:1252 length:402 start_codon:yes stop_codon:yes gene_type:complete
MKRSIKLTLEPIVESSLIAERKMSREMGAVNYFSGIVREGEEGRTIKAINYEAFEKMVLHQFELILNEIEERWPIESIRLIHRTGTVKVNESSLWIEVISPHRTEAFEACQWLIDEMKKRVPIWKHPIFTKVD